MNRFALFLLLLLPLSLSAQHTFSIVATDPVTGEVGSAGATCLTSGDCGGCGGAIIISFVVPDQGAINSQATVCLPNINGQSGANEIQSGKPASDVLSNLLTFDACGAGDTSSRQYGIITLDTLGMPESAGFTGSNALNAAGHVTGPNYAIQGNILLNLSIIDSMEAGFLNTPGPLCDKLMAALQGANVPGADSRCLSDGVSARSAFIRVARPGDDPQNLWLDLNVPTYAPGFDPIDSLQIKFDAFKTANGLPEPAVTQLSLFPNPAQEWVRIGADLPGLDAREIYVFDAMGKLVRQQRWTEVQEAAQVSVEGLGRGIYWVEVRENEQLKGRGPVLVW